MKLGARAHGAFATDGALPSSRTDGALTSLTRRSQQGARSMLGSGSGGSTRASASQQQRAIVRCMPKQKNSARPLCESASSVATASKPLKTRRASEDTTPIR